MNLLLALISGALLALSFPRYGTPAFAWIALVPLLVAISGWRGRPGPLPGVAPSRAFGYGLAAGLVYFIGTIYWTGTVVATFGGLATPIAVFAMLLLALYMALYPALTAVLTARMVARLGAAGLLVAPAAWMGTEYLRGVLFGGFPWVPLGNSQVTMLPVAQLASLLGVYGLSALVATINALIAYAVLVRGRGQVTAIASGVVLLAAIAGWGTWRIAGGELLRSGTPVRVGLLQGNIAQEDKWNPAEARRIFTTYIAMTRDAARRGAEFVLWPESSTPFMFEEHAEGGETIRALTRETGVPLLFGSDQIERQPPRMFNSAFLVSPDGETAGVYRKIHLVPFGEYIPGKALISFVSPLVQSLAEFAPGTSMVLLPVDGHPVSTAICYEVVYPSLVRDAVLQGSELLTTITNDAWYGQSSAPYQHFAMASMRAIEQGRYLARAANTGISGIVDPYGRAVERSELFEQVGLVGEARFLTVRTLYSRIGDLIAYVAIAVTLFMYVVAERQFRPRR
ncbi:MAG: apolipoprotein N-acyltransferase [Vicinamibacterales bacterium]